MRSSASRALHLIAPTNRILRSQSNISSSSLRQSVKESDTSLEEGVQVTRHPRKRRSSPPSSSSSPLFVTDARSGSPEAGELYALVAPKRSENVDQHVVEKKTLSSHSGHGTRGGAGGGETNREESPSRKSRKTMTRLSRSPPEHWKEIYEGIRGMRSQRDAPVDGLGTECLADRHATPETFRFQTLVSVMLSSQTKDEMTAAGVKRLQEHGLDVDTILATPESRLAEIIYPVGFYRNKAKYVKQVASILKESYGGDTPSTLEEIVALPGVGPKMAHIFLNVAYGRTEGIAVDVHVHRISNRLKWVSNTKTPIETEMELESWLPREYWAEINLLLVGFGQQICTPRNPKCYMCSVSHLCPIGRQEMKKKEVQQRASEWRESQTKKEK